MSEPRAHVALLVDYANLRQGLMRAEPDAAPQPARELPLPKLVAQALLRYADGLGRVSLARAYADWSREPEVARELSVTRLVPVLVPATLDGEDRSHIRLVVDAMEALYNGDEPDAFLLVSSDPSLVPLVRALRADGSQVIVVAYEAGHEVEMTDEADDFVPFERVLQGERPEPLMPRTRSRESEEASGVPERSSERGKREEGRGRREHARWDGPLLTEPAFDGYDWTRFVRLIDELEERLPFVGVRYLVNKVLAPHNCGIDDPRIKRDLINEAVDQGLIEMYTVGNVQARTDPVTACRLDRENSLVISILAGVAAERAQDEEAGDFDELDDDGDPEGDSDPRASGADDPDSEEAPVRRPRSRARMGE